MTTLHSSAIHKSPNYRYRGRNYQQMCCRITHHTVEARIPPSFQANKKIQSRACSICRCSSLFYPVVLGLPPSRSFTVFTPHHLCLHLSSAAFCLLPLPQSLLVPISLFCCPESPLPQSFYSAPVLLFLCWDLFLSAYAPGCTALTSSGLRFCRKSPLREHPYSTDEQLGCCATLVKFDTSQIFKTFSYAQSNAGSQVAEGRYSLLYVHP